MLLHVQEAQAGHFSRPDWGARKPRPGHQPSRGQVDP